MADIAERTPVALPLKADAGRHDAFVTAQRPPVFFHAS